MDELSNSALERHELGLIQRGLGLRRNGGDVESNASSAPIDVAQVPSYPSEQQVVFLAINTTVSADERGVKYVEVGVATLDTAQLADQRLPPGHDGGHWTEQIQFATFIAHPTATSYARDLSIEAHIPDWILGCTRKGLALWLEKVWQRTDDPEISILPRDVERNIVLITRSKEKLHDDLAHLGFALEQHHAILDVFSITDIYRQYRAAQSLRDTNIPRSFRAIREALRINEPIRQEPDKRSPSARTAHAILQAAIRCAVNNACLPGQRASGDAGRFHRPGSVTLTDKEALARLLSIRTTYTSTEIEHRVAASFDTLVQSDDEGLQSGEAPSVVSTRPLHPVTQPAAPSAPAQHSEPPQAPRGLQSSIAASNLAAACPRSVVNDTQHDAPPGATELPEDVEIDVRDYHRATATVLRLMALSANPHCEVADFWRPDGVSDRISTQELLDLAPRVFRVARVIPDSATQRYSRELRRALDSCISGRIKAYDYYAKHLTTDEAVAQNARQEQAIELLKRIRQLLYPSRPEINATIATQVVHAPVNQTPAQGSRKSTDIAEKTHQTRAARSSTLSALAKSAPPSPEVSLLRSVASSGSSTSNEGVLTPTSSTNGVEAAGDIRTTASSQSTQDVMAESLARAKQACLQQDPLPVEPVQVRPKAPRPSKPTGQFRSDSVRREVTAEYKSNTRQFLNSLLTLGKDRYPDYEPYGSVSGFEETGKATFDFYRCFARIVRSEWQPSQRTSRSLLRTLRSAIEGRSEIGAYYAARKRNKEGHVNFLGLLVELKKILEGEDE